MSVYRMYYSFNHSSYYDVEANSEEEAKRQIEDIPTSELIFCRGNENVDITKVEKIEDN